MKVFFSLCNGTLCFHFYRLEKGVAKGKVFQAEIGNFWVIRARDIYFVGGKRCFSPNSCQGNCQERFPRNLLEREISEFNAGECPKKKPFPWHEFHFAGRNCRD